MARFDLSEPDGRIEALRRMILIREFENLTAERYLDGEIPGFLHPYNGQEAVAVGACFALEEDDYVTSTHRGHGHCIAAGLDPTKMMSELFGKETGYSRGKGGHLHIGDIDNNFLGTNGVVASGVPQATGAALTVDLQDTDQVALSFFGDGGVAQGQMHEAINLGALWDLPVVYLIEHNLYGEGTPADLQHNIDDLSKISEGYGVPGEIVDGMNVEAVYETVAEARDRAVGGDGPTIVEMKTYRFKGHFVGDPEPYRDQEEVERWRQRDPISSFGEELKSAGIIESGEIEKFRSTARETVEEAIKLAKKASEPDPSDAYRHMFVEAVSDRSDPSPGEGSR